VPCRLATDDDIAAIRRLRVAWAEEDRGRTVADDEFVEPFAEWWRAERGHRRFWLWETDDGEPVGMVSVVTMRRMPWPGADVPSWGYVHQMFVLPPHRDGGVGSALLRAVVTACRDEGFEQLVLHPRERSVPFYERLGFAPAGDLLRLDLGRATAAGAVEPASRPRDGDPTLPPPSG
jgi:GNAT superfamily N-acetyltransferase